MESTSAAVALQEIAENEMQERYIAWTHMQISESEVTLFSFAGGRGSAAGY